MAKETALNRLRQIVPESETDWRMIQAEAYRIMGIPGSDSWSKSNDAIIQDIRGGHALGKTRMRR